MAFFGYLLFLLALGGAVLIGVEKANEIDAMTSGKAARTSAAVPRVPVSLLLRLEISGNARLRGRGQMARTKSDLSSVDRRR